MSKSSSSYILGFDGIRAIAVLFVIANHAGSYELLPQSDFVLSRLWLLFSGETGVMIFFTLSGFLITFLLLNEKREQGRILFKNFFIRRFLRLAPPLTVMLAMYFLLAKFGLIQFQAIALISAIFYCYNFLPQKFNSVELSHTWSLAVEEQFYLIWPFVVQAFKHKTIIILALALVMISVILTLLLPTISIQLQGKTYWLMESFRPMRWLIPASLPIMWGAIAAVFVHNGNRYIQSVNSIKPLIITFLLFICPVYLPLPLLPLSCVFQSLAIAILLTYIYNVQSSPIVYFLHLKPIRFIGKISYGLYIYQGLFLRTGPGSELYFQQFPLNLLLTITVALISYFTIEKYFLDLKRQYYQ